MNVVQENVITAHARSAIHAGIVMVAIGTTDFLASQRRTGTLEMISGFSLKKMNKWQDAAERLIHSPLVQVTTHLKKDSVERDKLGKLESRKRNLIQNPLASRSRGKAGRPLTVKKGERK